ncbi:MAG: tandem-95 repeat protein [Richelia sp. RM2_1_2]|nr:tandem-95 repeat protein [Richelia sp. SM2_1_7]NJM19316.1 tandem-95 repeat protein [Richelia sp. SM1_7_0]NJO60894.1 tandem-95 repeat protein [Richelia sp. RM2_1_2]
MAELFFNFHDNIGRTNPRELFIFGDAGQTATVQNGNGFNETVTLNSDGFAIVEISSNQGMSGTGVNNLGFQITSDDPIQAYFSNRSAQTTDLTIVFEKSSLGTEYVLSSIGSAFGQGFGEGGQFSVQATEDNTKIDVTLPDGQTFSQIINAGETFKFATGANNNSLGISIPFGFDLTGTLIKTTAPAAVFSGHSCTQIGNRPACDHIVEQMPPVDVLSNSYIVGEAFKNGLGDNLVRVVAARDNTQVTLDGSVVATLNAGQSFDFTLSTNAAQITTSEPALVAQYLQSRNLVGEGDPAMMFVPGQDAWLKKYKLATPAGSAAFNDNLVNVVIPTTALNSLELNGAAVDTSGFVSVGSSGFSVGNLEIAPGLFTIEASEAFQVSLFGFESFDSYLTFGAATFAQGVSNRPPVDILLSNADIDENSSNDTVIGNLTTTDPDIGDTHTYSLIDDAGGRFAINGNQLVVANGSLLDFETNTSHSITINTQDAGGLNYQETFTIAIDDVNEMPVANNDTATTDEDNSVTINVLANDTDSDGDTLTITGVSGSTGSVTIDGDNIVYNPNGQFESLNAGETATDTFSYTVSDGNGLNDTATVTVTINGVDEVIGNENPVLATNNGLTVDEDAVGNITSTQLQVTDADNTAAEITYTITDVTDNGNLFLDGTQINLNDTFTQADINNNRLTYDHDGSETTSDSFNFTVTDGAGGSVGSSMFDITVNPVNDAPVANNDAATTNQNEAVTIAVAQLLANDTDVENDTLTITSVGNATNGSVALNGNNVVFNPDAGFSGAASFEYTLSDGSETDNATVSVMVNPLSSNEILGTPGRDMLTGDDANNIITGFQSRDMLTGNGGADQFVYTNIRDAGDIITDFEIGSDTIVLTQLLDSLGYTGSDAIGDGYVSFGSSRGDAFVQIDQDGAAGTDFISRPLVLLQGVTEENLSANAQNSFVF